MGQSWTVIQTVVIQSDSQSCPRMARIQLLLLLLSSLVLTHPVTASPVPGDCDDMESVEDIIEMIDNIKIMTEIGLGDHIDWEDLDSYSISGSEWKDDLVEQSNELKEFKEYIDQNTLIYGDDPYHHRQFFRPPDNVNDLWVTEVSLASDNIIRWLDKINMALHGGYFSGDRSTFRQYREYEDRLTELTMISEVLNSFDIRKDLGDYLMMIRDDGIQRSITDYVTTELKHDVDCSYTILTSKNVTFYNTLTETIPKEKVVSYIQEFVANFFQVINSSELESNYGTLRDNLRNIIRNTDFDRVFSKMFLAFLLSRSLVLDVDIMEVFQNLDSLHRTIGEGWWSLTTGHWPEMVQFISTFVTKTIQSDKFWERLDELYHELVASYRTQYVERQQWLETSIKTQIIPFFKRVSELAKDKRQLTSLMKRLQSVDVVSYVEPTLDMAVTVLSRHYLSCYTAFYGKPDFNQLSNMVVTNSVGGFIKSVVITDWPEEQKVPQNWPSFVMKLQDGVLLILSGVLGSCSQPVRG